MIEHRVTIGADGSVKFIYSDALLPVAQALGGEQVVTRASHVEPHPTKGGWTADMRPSGGPVLGGLGTFAHVRHLDCDCDDCESLILAIEPFQTRQAALDAEIVWLRENKGM